MLFKFYLKINFTKITLFIILYRYLITNHYLIVTINFDHYLILSIYFYLSPINFYSLALYCVVFLLYYYFLHSSFHTDFGFIDSFIWNKLLEF